MRYIYITALIDFHISEKLKDPLKIKEGLFITNNPAHTTSHISTSSMLAIGSLEARYLTGSTPVIYKLDEQTDREAVHTEMVNFLREVQAFLTATWLIKDNSANCELGFAICSELQHVHSNALTLHYSDHSGNRKALSVDLSLLTEICALHRENFGGVREQDSPAHTSFRKSVWRLSRAMRFLQQARSSDDIGLKIANYCSFFEATLSTTSSELSHQLSERVAFFLRSSPDERLALFRCIKKAYNVRSKIVHGDILPQVTIDALVGISGNCDEAARQVTKKIIVNKELEKVFDATNDVLDSYMLNLIFGVTLNPTTDTAKH